MRRLGLFICLFVIFVFSSEGEAAPGFVEPCRSTAFRGMAVDTSVVSTSQFQDLLLNNNINAVRLRIAKEMGLNGQSYQEAIQADLDEVTQYIDIIRTLNAPVFLIVQLVSPPRGVNETNDEYYIFQDDSLRVEYLATIERIADALEGYSNDDGLGSVSVVILEDPKTDNATAWAELVRQVVDTNNSYSLNAIVRPIRNQPKFLTSLPTVGGQLRYPYRRGLKFVLFEDYQQTSSASPFSLEPPSASEVRIQTLKAFSQIAKRF